MLPVHPAIFMVLGQSDMAVALPAPCVSRCAFASAAAFRRYVTIGDTRWFVIAQPSGDSTGRAQRPDPKAGIALHPPVESRFGLENLSCLRDISSTIVTAPDRGGEATEAPIS